MDTAAFEKLNEIEVGMGLGSQEACADLLVHAFGSTLDLSDRQNLVSVRRNPARDLSNAALSCAKARSRSLLVFDGSAPATEDTPPWAVSPDHIQQAYNAILRSSESGKQAFDGVTMVRNVPSRMRSGLRHSRLFFREVSDCQRAGEPTVLSGRSAVGRYSRQRFQSNGRRAASPVRKPMIWNPETPNAALARAIESDPARPHEHENPGVSDGRGSHWRVPSVSLLFVYGQEGTSSADIRSGMEKRLESVGSFRVAPQAIGSSTGPSTS
nr:hypothetical protein [Sinorhizobium meliloti]